MITKFSILLYNRMKSLKEICRPYVIKPVRMTFKFNVASKDNKYNCGRWQVSMARILSLLEDDLSEKN